jgi:hypothetical protein
MAHPCIPRMSVYYHESKIATLNCTLANTFVDILYLSNHLSFGTEILARSSYTMTWGRMEISLETDESRPVVSLRHELRWETWVNMVLG